MSLFDGVRRAFRAPAERRRDVEREVEEELAFHLDMREQKLRAQGTAPSDAAAEARRRFGNVGAIRAACVETDTAELRADRVRRHIDDLARDLRVGFRSLRSAPAFTLSAAALLALGIGGTTAVFSVVNAIHFRPLPYPNADRLALVRATLPDPRCDRRCIRTPTSDEIAQLSAARSIETIGTLELRQGPVQTRSGTLVLEGAAVNSVLPTVLGLRAFIGRELGSGDFAAEAPGALVLSYSAWRTHFGGDSAIVGQVMTIGTATHRVVGVLAPQSELGSPIFSFNARTAEYFVPRASAATRPPDQVVVLVRPQVTWETAQAELSALLQHTGGDEWRATVTPLRDGLAARYEGSYKLLLGAAILVLFIACMNVGGLLVARLNDRIPELATRTILGAGRGQLVQQVAIETALIACLGASGGLLLAFYGTHAARLIPMSRLPFWTSVVMDGRVVALALGLALAGCIALSIAPAVVLSPARVMRGMRELLTAAPSRARLRGIIVSVELALSVVLLAGAGILIKQLVAAERRDIGSAKRSVVFLALSSRQRTGTDAAWRERVLAGLNAVPGVASVAVSGLADPVAHAGRGAAKARSGVYVDGRDGPVPDLVFGFPRVVTNEYFQTTGTPLVAGRAFITTDNASSTAVAVINAGAARRAFPGTSAIGRRFRIESGGSFGEWITIVGVTPDRIDALTGKADDNAQYFRPWTQSAATPDNIAVRLAGDSRRSLPVIRDAFQAIDPSMPVASVRAIEDWIDGTLWNTRFTTNVITAFAAFALILASLGVYATVSYVVGRRRRELAIRIAVGATRQNVVLAVLRSTAGVIIAGIAVGVVCSFGVSRVLHSAIYGASGVDLQVLGGVVIAMLAAGFGAAYLPARRAARADPAAILRAD